MFIEWQKHTKEKRRIKNRVREEMKMKEETGGSLKVCDERLQQYFQLP